MSDIQCKIDDLYYANGGSKLSEYKEGLKDFLTKYSLDRVYSLLMMTDLDPIDNEYIIHLHNEVSPTVTIKKVKRFIYGQCYDITFINDKLENDIKFSINHIDTVGTIDEFVNSTDINTLKILYQMIDVFTNELGKLLR